MSASLAHSAHEKPAVRRPPSFDRRSRYKYVRQVCGKTGIWVWQARAYLPLPVGSVHLGLYREERAAWEAVRLWIRAGADPCRGLPTKVLPKWVRKRPQDGLFDAVRRNASGERIVDPGGPYATPEAAHAAARLSADADWERHLRRRTEGAKAKQVCWPEVAGRPAFFQPTPFAKWEC